MQRPKRTVPPTVTLDLDGLPVAVLLLDLDGTIAACNPAAGRLLSTPRDSLLGAAGPAALGLGTARWQALRDAAVQTGVAEDEVRIGATAVRVVAAPGELAGRPVLQVVALEARPAPADEARPAPADEARPAPADEARPDERNDERPDDQQRIESLGPVAGGIAHDFVPGVEPPPPTRLEVTMSIPPLAGIRVLVADDEPSVRATVQRLLERRGATVVVAADGLEAEARLRDERFDLVILDITMPGRTGYDVLAFARANEPALPVVLMSGYIGRARGEGGEEEPDAFIEKPFTAKVIYTVVDEILRNRGTPR